MIETVTGEEAARLFASRAQVRLGGRGLACLRDLAAGFAEIPYENISKIIKSAASTGACDALRLPTEVMTDHIERGLGGTCFSLTFLLERMLKALGFDCYKVMADMNSGRNVHCLVVVRDSGARYIIDPGYALYQVLQMPSQGTCRVECPHASVEVERTDEGQYSLWTRDRSGRKWRYRFRDQPVKDSEFERHWIASFGKPTLRNICLTKMTSGGHIYLRKDFFKFTSRDGISKRRLKHDIETFIQQEFGIDGQWTEIARDILRQRHRKD